MARVTRIDIWKRDHVRASAVAGTWPSLGRACNAASTSSVTPLIFRPRAAATKPDQYSDGTLSRCAHLRTAETDAPISAAKTSCEGHRASKDRIESAMLQSLGHTVLSVKANMSHDYGPGLEHLAFMPRDAAASAFKVGFIARTKEGRESLGLTQEQFASLLGMDQGKYKQYETRTPLPHQYVEKFCFATGADQNWLFTGKGRKPGRGAAGKAA